MKNTLALPSLVGSALLVAITAITAGCKTDNASSSATGGGSSASACGSLYDAYSAYYARCSPTTSVPSRDGFVATCELQLAAPGASGATSALGDCASALQGLVDTCGDPGVTACKQPGGGSLAAGVRCGTDLQCASGNCKGSGVNETSSGNGATTITVSCGVCADRLAVGATCGTGDLCADGSKCSFAVGSGPNEGKCVAIVTSDVGGACGDNNGQAVTQCKSGLRCGADRKCAALLASGGPCEESSDCSYPLVCGPDNKCAAPKTAGTACTKQLNAGCARELVCSSSGTCAAVVRVAPGAACNESTLRCAQGSCNITSISGDGGDATGTCPSLLNEGDACDGLSRGTTCGGSALCISGKCTTFDPSTCK